MDGEVEPGVEARVDSVQSLLEVSRAHHLQRLPEDDQQARKYRDRPGCKDREARARDEERSDERQDRDERDRRHLVRPPGLLQSQRNAHGRAEGEDEG